MTPIAAAIARLLQRAESPVDPPPWLLPAQRAPFRQAIAALERYGGVLMALPIGSGKTYVGLALGAHFAAGEPIEVIAPAILRSHWHRTAAELGIPIRFSSHEAASRGHRPSGRGPVIIDESHRLRHPATCRYRTIAPGLIGRVVVLLSATPMVNRAADLAAQLLLGIRDDALRPLGVPSMARHLERQIATPPFAAVIVTGTAAAEDRPIRRGRTIEDWAATDAGFPGLVRSIERLRLARDGPVARLLRISLFRALASSPAALLASLGRYRRLLDHAAAARRAGHPVSRALIRSVTGADPEQLVWWEVLEPERLAADLALGDRRGLARLERLVRSRIGSGDPKLEHLIAILADRQPTVLFTTSVDTVHYLRRQPLGSTVAWVSGSAAGMGWLRATRAAVLDAFDPVTIHPGINPPTVLLASDVAAEGLNLRRAGRIIHYDLPWTAVRLDQRDGRAIRQGSTHASVEVIEFRVPAALEDRIGLEAAIARKRSLSAESGWFGARGRTDRIAGETLDHSAFAGVEGPAAAVAGFAISDGSSTERGLVLIRRGAGPWLEDRHGADLLLERAAIGPSIEVAPLEQLAIRSALDGAMADWHRQRNGDAVSDHPISPGALAMARAKIRDAARCRASAAVREAEGVLRFLGRGHTAGERMLVDRIAANDPSAFAEAAGLGPTGGAAVTTAVLIGLIIFREPDGPTSLPP